MSLITQAMVAPYFLQYQEKYGVECTLSLDVMEEIIQTSNDEATLLDDMHTAMTSSDENDDRSQIVEIDTTPGSAYSYAIKLDAQFEHDIKVLGQAAIEGKRGGAVIMLDLFKLFTPAVIQEVWPVPGTFKPGHGGIHAVHSGDNEPWDKEETAVTKVDGTVGKGQRSFYSDIVSNSAYGATLLSDKAKMKEKVGDIRGIKPKVSAIDKRLSNYKSSLTRAVQLAQRMHFVNSKTGMSCELVMDTDDNNNLVVTESDKVIFITDKTNKTKLDTITIGQFLALKVSEGAKYVDIVGTTTRAPKSGTGPTTVEVPDINTLDVFDKVTASYATFFDKLEEQVNSKDMKAYNALLSKLNGAGSDETILSLNQIMNGIEAILSKPSISSRLSSLLADDKPAKVA